MDEIRNGVTTDQCNPRRLSRKLNLFLNENNITKKTKRKRVLAWFLCASEQGCKVTRFDAEHIGDHCLNSTVSEIGRLDGIEVNRQETKRPNQFGSLTSCKEYWLDNDSKDKAAVFLGVTL